jgi:hypothetical protein
LEEFLLRLRVVHVHRAKPFAGFAEQHADIAAVKPRAVCGGISRLVLRAYSFSKSVERHIEAIHLFIVTYNLKIKQATIA